MLEKRKSFGYNKNKIQPFLDEQVMKKWLFSSCLLPILVMGACNLPQKDPEPTSKPGILYTEAAMTVSVQLTAAGIGKPLSTVPSATVSPEETPTPEPTETFTVPTVTPKGETNETPAPCDQVKFIKDVTIPDEMDLAPGEAFTKTWRLENAGSCAWTIGYLLYFESGDAMGGPSSKELTSVTVLPGETVDVSVDLIAPQETGTYQGNWMLRNVKGEGFGVGEYSKPFWVKINVVEGAGMMFDFNTKAKSAAWGFGTIPVDYVDLGGEILTFDKQGDPGDPYVSLKNDQKLEDGRISGILLATFPPLGEGKYIIGRFPDYKVNAGDLLFGRVGLTLNPGGKCGNGDVDFIINLMVEGDPATMVTLGEWIEVCDDVMKTFEIDLDDYKGDTVQIFLVVIANTESTKNFAVWDSLSIHR
jgi:hypothetical protein